jgi:hypothetical protein
MNVSWRASPDLPLLILKLELARTPEFFVPPPTHPSFFTYQQCLDLVHRVREGKCVLLPTIISGIVGSNRDPTTMNTDDEPNWAATVTLPRSTNTPSDSGHGRNEEGRLRFIYWVFSTYLFD